MSGSARGMAMGAAMVALVGCAGVRSVERREPPSADLRSVTTAAIWFDTHVRAGATRTRAKAALCDCVAKDLTCEWQIGAGQTTSGVSLVARWSWSGFEATILRPATSGAYTVTMRSRR